MNEKIYFCLNIGSDVPIGEDVLSFLSGLDPLGIWEMDAFSIKVYFRKKRSDATQALAKRFPRLVVSAEPYRSPDWVSEYEKNLKPMKIGKKFLVAPFATKRKAKDFNMPGKLVIKLVPGEAFGTGEHFTTRSCLKTLEELRPFPRSVLDLGTGTGILAIAASRLGAKSVRACDNDMEACGVAKETIKLNKEKIFISCSSAEAFSGSYDLVIANILAETLIELSSSIDRLCGPRGRILLSGISLRNGDKVREVFERLGFVLERALSDAEWFTFLFARKAKGKR